MTFFEVISLYLLLIFSKNRRPPRIKSGAGFFGIMLYSASPRMRRGVPADGAMPSRMTARRRGATWPRR